MADNYVIRFENLRMTDVERVGGKNASLGEMISQLTEKGVRVPGGFATTADAYRAFLAHNGLSERISAALAKLDVEDVAELARVGKEIRQWILDTPFPEQLDAEIEAAWNKWLPMPAVRTFPLPYALPQPPKTCPTHHLPANRKPS